MVVFTCNHCGDSLQKPKVAKHYQFQCRKYPDLTCVDCHKDFRDDEYVQHTKCITENERYGGQDYIAKPNANKGERKQNQWIDIVQNVLKNDTNLSSPERNFLNQIAHYQNIPRKKAKFINFIKNIMGNRVNWATVENVWNKMETAFKDNKEISANKPNESNNANGSKNGIENAVAENENNENMAKENENNENSTDKGTEKKKKSKKRKLESEEKIDTLNTIDEAVNINPAGSKSNDTENSTNKTKKIKKNKNEIDTNNSSLTTDNKMIYDENNKNTPPTKKSKKRNHESSNIVNEKQSNDNNDVLENNVEKKKKKKNNSENIIKIEENLNGAIITDNETKPLEENIKTNKFDWKNEISKVLEKKAKLSLKKLQKKVVGCYIHSYTNKSEEKAIIKFEKTLKKMNNIVIENDMVMLTQC